MTPRFCLAAALLASCALSLPAQFGSMPHPVARTGGNYMSNYYLPPSGSSTPWWPSWSPDGKYLAFAMDGSLWRLRVGENAAEEIGYAPEYLSSPEWSPDGRWLAYTADDGRTIQLRILEVATGRHSALTQGNSLNLDPAWSPDGRRLAYVTTEPNGYFNIRVMNVEAGRAGSSIAVTTDHRFGRDRLYVGDTDMHIEPAWSPDGRELIFVSNRGIALGSGARRWNPM
jgi:TolB protein